MNASKQSLPSYKHAFKSYYPHSNKLLEVNAYIYIYIYIYIFCGGGGSLEMQPQLLVGQKKRTSRRKRSMNTTLTDAEMILIRSVTTVTCSVYTMFCYMDLIFTCTMWTENIKPIKKIKIFIVNNVTYWITYIRKGILNTFLFILNYFWPYIYLNVIFVYYIDKKEKDNIFYTLLSTSSSSLNS